MFLRARAFDAVDPLKLSEVFHFILSLSTPPIFSSTPRPLDLNIETNDFMTLPRSLLRVGRRVESRKMGERDRSKPPSSSEEHPQYIPALSTDTSYDAMLTATLVQGSQ